MSSNKVSFCEEELQFKELPKFVRWDKTELKFIIEKHPQLIKEVDHGVRKKPVMSGSKSKTLSIVQKYKDILARLQLLDQANHLMNNYEEK